MVSAKLNSWPDYARFLIKIGFGVSTFNLSNHLVRGAIAIGSYYRNGPILISPALISAYEYESKYAKTPRVLLTPEFINSANAAIDQETDKLKYRTDFKGMSMPDLDGFQYLNYLPFYSVTPQTEGDNKTEAVRIDENQLADCIEKHRAIVMQGLNSDISVQSKYIWLGHYHNYFIESEPNMNLGSFRIPDSELLIKIPTHTS